MYGAGREISFTNIQDITTYPAQTRMISRFSIILSALYLSNHPSISTLSSIYPSIRLISRAPKEVGELPRRVAQLPQRVAQHPGPLRAARQRRLGRRRRRRRLRAGRNEAYAARPCLHVCVWGGGIQDRSVGRKPAGLRTSNVRRREAPRDKCAALLRRCAFCAMNLAGMNWRTHRRCITNCSRGIAIAFCSLHSFQSIGSAAPMSDSVRLTSDRAERNSRRLLSQIE